MGRQSAERTITALAENWVSLKKSTTAEVTAAAAAGDDGRRWVTKKDFGMARGVEAVKHVKNYSIAGLEKEVVVLSGGHAWCLAWLAGNGGASSRSAWSRLWSHHGCSVVILFCLLRWQRLFS